MRVIAGRYKGRRLQTPTWEGLRPTSDRLRETFFNVVSARIAGARFLDGYAGTGAVGIEALSRGALHVTFVERDRRAVRLIEANLRRCGVTADYTIDAADLPATLRQSRPAAFDLIWLDPPYDLADVGESLELAGHAVDRAGLIVLERATRHEPIVPPTLRRVRDLRSGDSTLTFFATGA